MTKNVRDQIIRQDLEIDLHDMSRRISNWRLMINTNSALFIGVWQHCDKSISKQFQDIRIQIDFEPFWFLSAQLQILFHHGFSSTNVKLLCTQESKEKLVEVQLRSSLRGLRGHPNVICISLQPQLHLRKTFFANLKGEKLLSDALNGRPL